MSNTGLRSFIRAGIRFFTSLGTNYVGLKPPAVAPATSFDLILFNQLPGGTEAITVDATGQLSTAPIAGGSAHTQNTDTGTTNATFAIDSGGTGFLLKNSSGELQIRNLADSAFNNLRVANLVVEGTQTTVNSETVTIADNIFLLNSDVTGTPTENGGIEIERGTSTNAQLLWQESSDRFAAGVAGALRTVAQISSQTFTSGDLVGGALTFTHGLGNRYPMIQVIDNNNKLIYPDDITFTSTTVTTIDLTNFEPTMSGTYRVEAVG